MKYIIIWRYNGKYADLNNWHEPNTYESVESAQKAINGWLFQDPFSIVPWDGRLDRNRL